jgi:hypothetical protein
MRDVIVVAIIAVFFALCVAYVRWCDRIIGPDPDGLRDEDDDGSAVDERTAVDAGGAIGATAVDRAPDAEAVRA